MHALAVPCAQFCCQHIGCADSLQEIGEADGVRINCICPWVIDTAMGRMGREKGPRSMKNLIKEHGMLK